MKRRTLNSCRSHELVMNLQLNWSILPYASPAITKENGKRGRLEIVGKNPWRDGYKDEGGMGSSFKERKKGEKHTHRRNILRRELSEEAFDEEEACRDSRGIRWEREDEMKDSDARGKILKRGERVNEGKKGMKGVRENWVRRGVCSKGKVLEERRKCQEIWLLGNILRMSRKSEITESEIPSTFRGTSELLGLLFFSLSLSLSWIYYYCIPPGVNLKVMQMFIPETYSHSVLFMFGTYLLPLLRYLDPGPSLQYRSLILKRTVD